MNLFQSSASSVIGLSTHLSWCAVYILPLQKGPCMELGSRTVVCISIIWLGRLQSVFIPVIRCTSMFQYECFNAGLPQAAEDLLTGRSGAVLMAETLPGVATSTVLPFFMHMIPYGVRVCLVSTMMASSFLAVALAESPAARLAGQRPMLLCQWLLTSRELGTMSTSESILHHFQAYP